MLRTLPTIMLLLTVGHSIVLAQDACEGLTPVDASAETERIGESGSGEPGVWVVP